MTTTSNTTPTGLVDFITLEPDRNLHNDVLSAKIIGKLIPEVNDFQQSVLNGYYGYHGPITTIQIKGKPVNIGSSTVATAIALTEGLMGKRVIFITESLYETQSIIQNIGRKSGLLNNCIPSSNKFTVLSEGSNLAGRKADIVIYETYKACSGPTNTATLQNLITSWQLWTNCDRVFVMHR